MQRILTKAVIGSQNYCVLMCVRLCMCVCVRACTCVSVCGYVHDVYVCVGWYKSMCGSVCAHFFINLFIFVEKYVII